jgi:hypothetical protein
MQVTRTVTYQWNTTNQSFIDMHNYLMATGRRNNAFFLVLYDSDLLRVDPRDARLNAITKAKILKEVMANFWYFIREVVRIPTEGGQVGGGSPYILNRGNLAMHFLMLNNYNLFLELPRQIGKTTGALVHYLWVFNYRTSNTEILFIHQKHQRAKDNLHDLKELREVLPSYLRMDAMIMSDGTRAKAKNTVETLEHPTNFNKIKTMAGCRSAAQARGSARGMTVAMQYWDEFAFINYNKDMYLAAIPAFSTAKRNAINSGSPYGILLTTTPGVLTTDEGQFAYDIRNGATQWNEAYYDYSREMLEQLAAANTKSSFFHVIYSYQQLGRDEQYFADMCKEMQYNYPDIRREILLEWSKQSSNNPFSQEDLETIESLCLKDPKSTLLFGNAGQYQVQIWSPIDNMQYPPIIGVDVAGGYQSDSTAITIIDSKTTRVVATFNCNYISMPDTAGLLEQLVYNYMRNAVVNIERDGGWGGSVLQMLVKSKIKKNLYYEIKDRILEEKIEGGHSIKRPQKVKQYGTNTREVRDRLFEILFQRVQYHKDKFIAPILHSELETLEYKKNGRIEHSSDAHDDQLFSYMQALYVWYDGQNLANFGIYKTTLQTDQELDEATIELDHDYGETIDLNVDSSVSDSIEEQYKHLGINNTKYMTVRDFKLKEYEKDQKTLQDLLDNDPIARKAYVTQYHLDPENLGPMATRTHRDIPDNVFIDDPYEQKEYDVYQGSLGSSFKNISDFR